MWIRSAGRSLTPEGSATLGINTSPTLIALIRQNAVAARLVDSLMENGFCTEKIAGQIGSNMLALAEWTTAITIHYRL